MDALNKKTIEDIDVNGKRVLARCDFNVPLKDGEITNDKRIVAALPTIKYLMEHGAKVILCSHLGRPKGEYKPEFSLAPVAKRLSEYLGVEVKLAEDPEVVGANAKAMASELKDGEVMLLENVRYRAEETKNEENFSKELASLADVFVNDAFGTAHRVTAQQQVLLHTCLQFAVTLFKRKSSLWAEHLLTLKDLLLQSSVVQRFQIKSV